MSRKAKSGNGNPDLCPRYPGTVLFLLRVVTLFTLALISPHALARDAAFLDPGTAAGASAGDDAIKVEPKGDIDIGESVLNVARHIDLFFVNQSGDPVKVEKVAVNGDGNVATEIANDDCSKQGSIPPGSRCSIEVLVTPSSPGPWSAEALLTHNGAGRIARAKLMGKTAGAASGEKKEMGLALNTKEAAPVNFGDVDVGGGKIVRSALMVNDSPEPITLYSIDVIEASNGLKKLDQGCAIDMELKPGESCPVTLIWTPSSAGQISTDLIIRHSGRLGFAVIPIRGVAKGGMIDAAKDKSAMAGNGKSGSIPPPPTAQEIEKAANGKIPAVSADALGVSGTAAAPVNTNFYLIGTVGNRAVILKPDGKTAIVSSGDEVNSGDRQIKILSVGAKSVDILMDGKKKTLVLEAAPDLIATAFASSKTKDSDKSPAPSSNEPPPTAKPAAGPSGGAK